MQGIAESGNVKYREEEKSAMVKIKLVPDLEHCIETLAKRRHAEFAQILLESQPGSADVGEKLEILRLFLETADFSRLRAESEKHLVEGRRVRFVITGEGGTAAWEMQVT